MQIWLRAKKRSLMSLLNVANIRSGYSIEKLEKCEYIVTIDDKKNTGEFLLLLRNTDLQYKELK